MTAAEKSGVWRSKNSVLPTPSRRLSCTTSACNHCELRKEKQMPRKGKSAVSKDGGAIARTARKLTSKLNPLKRSQKKAGTQQAQLNAKQKAAPESTKEVRTDVPLDL